MRQIKCPMCQSKVDVSSETEAREIVCPACGENIRLDAITPEAPAAEVPEPNRYEVRRYEAGSGGGRVSGLIATVFLGLFTTLVVTVLVGVIGSFFWLVMIFPILHGLGVGLPIGWIGRLTRARFPWLLALVGMGFAVLSVFGLHFLEYLGFAADPNSPAVGFWGFMDIRAQEGVQIGKASGGDKGTNLGYTGSVVYWLLELIITVVAAIGGAVALVSDPYCEQCRDWKKKEKLGPYRLDMVTAAEAVANGCPVEAVAPTDTSDTVTIEIFSCPHCEGGEIDVRVGGARPLGGNKTQTVTAFITYPNSAQDDFDEVAHACKKQKLEAS